MNDGTIITLLVILLIGGGLYVLFRRNQTVADRAGDNPGEMENRRNE